MSNTRNRAHDVVDDVFDQINELREQRAPVDAGVASFVTIIQPGKSGSQALEVRSTDTIADVLSSADISFHGLAIKKQSQAPGSSPMDVADPHRSRVGEGSFNLILAQKVRGG